MKIGSIGSLLARGLAAAGHQVILSSPLPALANLPKDLLAQALSGEAPKIRDQLVTR